MDRIGKRKWADVVRARGFGLRGTMDTERKMRITEYSERLRMDMNMTMIMELWEEQLLGQTSGCMDPLNMSPCFLNKVKRESIKTP